MNRSQKYRLKDIEAYRKRKREYARTPEQRRIRCEYQKKWYWKNVEKCRAYARALHAKHREKASVTARKHHLLRNYGLTVDQFAAMLAKQNGVCAICGKPPKQKNLHVDHCHKTGRIRGLLCGSCNGRVGWLEIYSATISKYPL